jgi:uncharacterized membrane protein YhhN
MNLTIILFGVFLVVALVHILMILLNKEKARQISKAFIMPSLLAVYVSAPGNPHVFVVLALVFGWMGDVLLIRIEQKVYFMLGLASFLLGHLLYILTFVHILGLFNLGGNAVGAAHIDLPALALNALPGIGLGIVVFRLIKPPKDMYAPVILYMIILEALAFFGFQILLARPDFAGLLVLSGCFCFMISDTILAYYTFRKPKMYGTFFLMLYYIAAQAELVLGIIKITS